MGKDPYEFKKLSEVEALSEAPEKANVLVEVNGEIKRVPGGSRGGSGDEWDLVLKVTTNSTRITSAVVAAGYSINSDFANDILQGIKKNVKILTEHYYAGNYYYGYIIPATIYTNYTSDTNYEVFIEYDFAFDASYYVTNGIYRIDHFLIGISANGTISVVNANTTQ